MLLFLLGCVHALGTGAIGPSDARLPLDPAVQRGTLANGKAGSLLEDDDQRGLAHVLEHMAFKGSAHFAEGELVTWFESVGMRYGAPGRTEGGDAWRGRLPAGGPGVRCHLCGRDRG